MVFMPFTCSGVNHDVDSDITTRTRGPTNAPKTGRGHSYSSSDTVLVIELSSDSDDAGNDSDVEIVHFKLPPPGVRVGPPKRKRNACGPLPRDVKKLKSNSTPERPNTFTVKGHTLRPTVVFDTFWYFSAERKAIDDRRRVDQPWPWTTDDILDKYSFCNTFRVLDKTTQYIIDQVIEKGSEDPEEVVFRVLLFNTFTKIETWELLDEELGPLTWKTYNRDKYRKVLSKAKDSGQALYTGSFIKPAPHFGYTDNFMNHLLLLEIFMEHELVNRLLGAKYMADVYEYIVSFPSMGDFTTYQLMLNLSYTNILNFHRNDFVVPGPGAISGLRKMFGSSIKTSKKGFEVEVIRWLTDTQDQHFKRLGIRFSGLGPDKLPMDVADVEHTLCEVDKYSRLAHPQYRGKRTEMRSRRDNEHAALQRYPRAHLPKAWSHPDRKILRIRPGGPPVVQKRYTISKIGGKRQGEDGVEYLVYWLGYPDTDATWEPEEVLMDDAPAAIAEYLQGK